MYCLLLCLLDIITSEPLSGFWLREGKMRYNGRMEGRGQSSVLVQSSWSMTFAFFDQI